jgi:glutamate synthase domain-containing protein 2
VHGWDYRIDSGVSAYNNEERLERFPATIDGDEVFVDADAVEDFLRRHPQPDRDQTYQGRYHTGSSPMEANLDEVRELAANGLSRVGAYGRMVAMGVPRDQLPSWDDIQIVTAQIARWPLLEDEPVSAETIIGPNAAKPLRLSMPLFISDMSFGALSEEAKVALSRGADAAGTAICSGEGGRYPEVQQASGRYMYELASGKFGWSFDVVRHVQSLHFKFGQATKTGAGGHLPASKITKEIAEIRKIPFGSAAISPARFPDWGLDDLRDLANEIRRRSSGIPIGAKMSAQHIEADIEAALSIGVDYIILDGRGGATGASPQMFRDNISVPTIPALARARAYLDRLERRDVTLVVTGGLRTPADFVKALALGADAVAIANSALHAIGCVSMRACHTNNCPVGIATQQRHLRARLPMDEAPRRLTRFLNASVELMQALARACGHHRLSDFTIDDLTTFDPNMHALAGVPFGGIRPQ